MTVLSLGRARLFPAHSSLEARSCAPEEVLAKQDPDNMQMGKEFCIEIRTCLWAGEGVLPWVCLCGRVRKEFQV